MFYAHDTSNEKKKTFRDLKATTVNSKGSSSLFCSCCRYSV